MVQPSIKTHRYSIFSEIENSHQNPYVSDTTAEAAPNKLFSTSMPIACLLENLSLLISSSFIEVDVTHIPCHDNDLADALRRWDGTDQPPHHFLMHDRFHLTLAQLWNWSSDLG